MNVSVAIIGCGPAGLAVAETIKTLAPETNVVLFDKGRKVSRRLCPVDQGGNCRSCNAICNVLSGFGGALQYGDAVKLSRFPAGRRLKMLVGEDYTLNELEVLGFFGVKENEFSCESSTDSIVRPYPVAELTEGRLGHWLNEKYRLISSRCDLRLVTNVQSVKCRSDRWQIESIDSSGRHQEIFDYVVAATGRAGFSDLSNWLADNSVSRRSGNISIGVRFEVPAPFLAPLYNVHKDFKMTRWSQGVKLKSFCFSAHPLTGGRLKFCHYQDQFSKPIVLLDGHTRLLDLHEGPSLANVAVLAQVNTEHFSARDWMESSFVPNYVRRSKGLPIWQPLSEIRNRPRLENAPSPSIKSIQQGKIGELISDSILQRLIEFYEGMVRMATKGNAVNAENVLDNTAVIAPVAEYLWDSVDLSPCFESSKPKLFVIGDCAGKAQGALQSALSGIVAGKAIASQLSVGTRRSSSEMVDAAMS